MNKLNFYVFLLGFTVLVSCNTKEVKETDAIDALLEKRYEQLLSYPVDAEGFPRNYRHEENEIHKVRSKDWTSGFFVGNLWNLYNLTGNEAYKARAIEWTPLMEDQKLNGRTHDMGFKVFCSFGNGLKIDSENQYYKDVIVESSNTLITRFNENVECTRSWDFNADIWEFPVIIDNMMNLELLFETTKLTQDSTYHKLAVRHADKTLKHHFRPDNSTYHVVVYDTISGQPVNKVTHQGINDDSAWARGQGWAIYGYTMSYRYTKDPAYLAQAEATANYFINHPNLREDGIAYWDFDDPNIPNAPRDVSASTVVASALVELYGYTNNQAYLDYSKKVVNTLSSEEYILEADFNAPFILDHSTGNYPKDDEIDEPIVYADYYFLETLLRLREL